MRLLMLSGDRQVAIGERGPFHAMQREFSRWFERIDVLCPRPSAPQTVHVIHDRVHFHPADVGRAGMVGWLERRGSELLAEHGHELIVSHDYGWFYNGLAAARLSRRRGVPYLSELHHVPGHPVAASARERLDRLVAERYVGRARHRARAFRVVNSTEMPELLRRWGVPEEKILVLPSLYIDLATFRPKSPESPESPAGPTPAPAQDVVFVGRLVENKGLLTIADALGRLARSGRPASALFIGRGPLRAALEARLRAAGVRERARFIDWVDGPEELAEHCRSSRVLVCASTCEGGPRVTVEAMACGTPVVSTPVGVMGELLADGKAGRLVGFDAESLARTLGEVLGDEDLRRALGTEAHARAQRFEAKATLRGYATGLLRLVGAREVRWGEGGA